MVHLFPNNGKHTSIRIELIICRAWSLVSGGVDCGTCKPTTSMLGSWEDRIDNSCGTAKITIDEEWKSLSAHIIAKAAWEQ